MRKIKTNYKILNYLLLNLNKYFNIHIRKIVPEHYYENGNYVISEPKCLGCRETLKNYITH